MTDTLTPEKREEIRKRAEAATPGNLDTVNDPNDEYGGRSEGVYECPMCNGDGSVDGVTYCNFDDVAMGVQFFGIGEEHGKYEQFFRAANPAAVLALLSALDAAIERAEKAEALWGATKAAAVRAVDVLDAFADVFTEMKTKDSLGDAAVCADASRSLFAAMNAQQEAASPTNNFASTNDARSELTALRARVAELEAGGCARDQGTTQYCAEAVALQKRVAVMQDALEIIAGKRQCIDNLMSNQDVARAALNKEPGK